MSVQNPLKILVIIISFSFNAVSYANEQSNKLGIQNATTKPLDVIYAITSEEQKDFSLPERYIDALEQNKEIRDPLKIKFTINIFDPDSKASYLIFSTSKDDTIIEDSILIDKISVLSKSDFISVEENITFAGAQKNDGHFVIGRKVKEGQLSFNLPLISKHFHDGQINIAARYTNNVYASRIEKKGNNENIFGELSLSKRVLNIFVPTDLEKDKGNNSSYYRIATVLDSNVDYKIESLDSEGNWQKAQGFRKKDGKQQYKVLVYEKDGFAETTVRATPIYPSEMRKVFESNNFLENDFFQTTTRRILPADFSETNASFSEKKANIESLTNNDENGTHSVTPSFKDIRNASILILRSSRTPRDVNVVNKLRNDGYVNVEYPSNKWRTPQRNTSIIFKDRYEFSDQSVEKFLNDLILRESNRRYHVNARTISIRGGNYSKSYNGLISQYLDGQSRFDILVLLEK